MAHGELVTIADAYPAQDRAALPALAERYRRRSEGEILELAAVASEILLDSLTTLGLEPDANPQLLEAFHLQYPNVDPASLVGRSADELQGFANGVKGKYFEVLVRDELNSGEMLGELQLEPGQVARLAESSVQRGWDLEILDQHGETVEQVQLKATESMSYVREALGKYPDIRVAVPEGLDDSSTEIIGTGVSHSQLEQVTEQQLEELSEGAISNALHTTAEFAVDVIPVGSALVIGVIEGRRYLMDEATLRESMRRGAGQLPRATAYSGISTALAAAGLGLAAIPVVMGLRAAESRISRQINLSDNLASRTAELEQLKLRG